MTVTTMANMVAAVPIIPARDVQLAVTWYCDHLGFAAVHVEREYGVVSRGPLQLHFWGPSDVPPEHSDYMFRIHVDGIDELYEECRRRGIVHPTAPLEPKPWGSREFAVVDRDGNLLTFSEALDAGGPLERELPNLAQVLGGYLHQDFELDYASVDAALGAAAAEAGEQALRAARELDTLLGGTRSDSELATLVERLTAGYSPVDDGWAIRDWLLHARDVLRGAR